MMTNRFDNDNLGPTVQRRAFKQQLTQRMAEKRITAAELSRRARISKDAVSSYTTMRSLPTEETLAKIARVLSCKPESLLKITEADSDIASLVEVREYSKPGYKLIVARVPVPIEDVTELFSKLMAYAESHSKKSK
jgi:transcriptional regulator with XRE-family HTH domain